jgi:hypothetical protein
MAAVLPPPSVLTGDPVSLSLSPPLTVAAPGVSLSSAVKKKQKKKKPKERDEVAVTRKEKKI